jgi:hypothetical protein
LVAWDARQSCRSHAGLAELINDEIFFPVLATLNGLTFVSELPNVASHIANERLKRRRLPGWRCFLLPLDVPFPCSLSTIAPSISPRGIVEGASAGSIVSIARAICMVGAAAPVAGFCSCASNRSSPDSSSAAG